MTNHDHDHDHDHTHDHDSAGDDETTDSYVLHVILGLVAVIVVRFAIGDGYKAFVRVGMRWPLIASAVVLAACVVADLVVRDRDHVWHRPHLRPGIYLIAPVLFALAVAPQPLGSYAAARSNVVPSPSSPFPPVQPGDGPAEMTLIEFNQRAIDRDGATLTGVAVQLTGFVMSSGELRIARFRMACCAADGQAAIVGLDGLAERPAADRWVTVIGTFAGMSGDVPTVVVDSLVAIRQPADPYEPT